MDLWIRNQDKTVLTKVNNIYTMENTIWFEVPFYENMKKTGLTVTGHNHKLGNYSSKERCIEILDEIQEHICMQGKSKITDINEHGEISGMKFYSFVYEMPEG